MKMKILQSVFVKSDVTIQRLQPNTVIVIEAIDDVNCKQFTSRAIVVGLIELSKTIIIRLDSGNFALINGNVLSVRNRNHTIIGITSIIEAQSKREYLPELKLIDGSWVQYYHVQQLHDQYCDVEVGNFAIVEKFFDGEQDDIIAGEVIYVGVPYIVVVIEGEPCTFTINHSTVESIHNPLIKYSISIQ